MAIQVSPRLSGLRQPRSLQKNERCAFAVGQPIRILLVDKRELSRGEVRHLLENAGGLVVVGEAGESQSAFDLTSHFDPDVVVLSVETFSPDDLRTVVRIGRQFPTIKIMVLSSGDSQEFLMLEALRRGASGCLLRSASQPSEIAEAVRAVHRGEAILSPRVAGLLLDEMTR